jgi:hypothetical protein
MRKYRRFLYVKIFVLLACSLAFCGYGTLRWGSSIRAVKSKYPSLKKVKNPCYFEGVNVFGRDTLVAYQQKISNEELYKRTFFFYRKQLVAVDLHYRDMTLKFFRKKIIKPLKESLGKKKYVYKTQNDKTKKNCYYIWRRPYDVIVAMYGHFKNVRPENLDWVRVKFYNKDFYDLKFKDRFKLAGGGKWKIFF